jgi:hypothetical protein
VVTGGAVDDGGGLSYGDRRAGPRAPSAEAGQLAPRRLEAGNQVAGHDLPAAPVLATPEPGASDAWLRVGRAGCGVRVDAGGLIYGHRRAGAHGDECRAQTASAPPAGPGNGVAGDEVPATVLLPASQLAPGDAWRRLGRAAVWVRALTLGGWPATSEVVADAVGTTVVGTSGDGVKDGYEEVVYE